MTVEAPRPVWQVSGRIARQDLSGYLLRHGLALIGPGDDGPWSPDRGPYEFDREVIQRFATEPSVGDAILLRTNQSTITAVGLIASDYLYLDKCDDVGGFDLQHGMRVRWYRLPQNHDFGFAITAGMASKFSRIRNQEVIGYADQFIASPPTHWQTAPLPKLPDDEPMMTAMPEDISDQVGLVSDLVPLYRDGDTFGQAPLENELTVHLVVPFLRALGWPQELIGIEWQRIDAVLFERLPRSTETLQFLIEVKRLDSGAESALGQAIGYAEALRTTANIVVTDGVRYRMYDGAPNYRALAYANLTRMKESSVDLIDRLRRP